MTHTDEELDALVRDLEAEAVDLGRWGINQGSLQANMSATLARTSANAITALRDQLDAANARADRAEAALAAQIAAAYEAAATHYENGFPAWDVFGQFMRECRSLTPADATAALARLIAEAEARGMREAAGIAKIWYHNIGKGTPHEEILAAAIRAQPHDRTALDRRDAATRAKALRDAADATLGLATGHECRAAILAMIDREASHE